MTLSLTRFALALALAAGAQASTINFTTNAASGSCFTNTFNDVSSGCANPAAALTFTNAQGDSASLLWGGVTNSIGFASGPVQSVNYGSFTLTYLSNNGDVNPVTIPQTSFLMIIKEFSPATIFFPAIVANLTGVSGNAGSVGPNTADLEATFSPATVTDGVSATFLVTSAVQVLNGSGQTNIGGQVQNFATPEPSTWLMLGTAVPFLLKYRRRS